MKKNNYIVMAVAVLISAFLLWLWFRLGFNEVDNPLDLVVSVLWWVVDALIVVGIVRFEKARQRQIRTIYVAPNALFNSERGVVAVEDARDRVDVMQSILEQLAYDFSNEDMPGKDDFEYRYVVQTDSYEKADEDAPQVEAFDLPEGQATDGAAAAAAMVAETGEKPAKAAQPKWEGKVIKIDRQNGNVETKFSDLEELKAALAA